MEKEYVKQFNDKEKIAYEIAKKNLESSFDLKRSLGFIQFVNSKKTKN